MKTLINVFKKIRAPIFWLLIWLFASQIISNELVLVSPITVVCRLGTLLSKKAFYTSVCFSTLRILSGFLIGLLLGCLLASLSGKVRLIRDFLSPLMTTLKAIPVASFTILALFIIPSEKLSILVTVLISLPIVYANILTGIDSTDKKLVDMARVFNISGVKKTVYIYFSQVLPYFKSASSVASGLSWKSGVAAELIVITSGSIGEMLYRSKVGLESADLFAWTFTVIILSFLTELLFSKLTDLAWYAIERA